MTARDAAFRALLRVEKDDAYLNLLLPSILRSIESNRDRRLVTELSYGTARWQGSYDAILASISSKPIEEMDVEVLISLRLGCHQILKMRIPTHAAVSEMVDLIKHQHGVGASKYVNAILRKVSQKGFQQWISELSRGLSEIDSLCIEYSHPRWIIEEFAKLIPPDELRNLLLRNNEPAGINIVSRPGRDSHDFSADANAVRDPRTKYGYRWNGQIDDIPNLTNGSVGIQDIGSQLVVEHFFDAPIFTEETFWVDLCAGPGGKMALLEAVGSLSNIEVWGSEISPHRCDLVKNLLQNPDRVLNIDGRQWSKVGASRILVDAPCSGLGAIRRRPESRWRKSRSDLQELNLLQIELLQRAIEVCAQGGVIGYSTCSPIQSETDVIIKNVLATQPVKLQKEYRYWPHIDDTDGMYLAILEKVAN